MSHRALPLVAAFFALAACASPAPRGLDPAPAPAPLPEAPAEEPDRLDAGPELEEEELRSTERALLGDVAYDLPMEANTWVEAELDFLVGQRKAVIGRWLERAEYYEPFVTQVLAGYGLPTDLHHLAMVESGYLPKARSHAGAVGIWQFMPATGRGMGLRIDSLVDERMDPVRSTHAAARHLKELHRAFGGDWSLAAAAYNAGTGRISRGMSSTRAKNFWELAVWGTLAQETKQYVPRLYAVTIIGRDRTRFGFAPPRQAVRTFAYDSVRTDLATPLAELAAMGSLPASALTELNPHLLRGTTPQGSYWVWTPKGTGKALQQAFLDSEFRKHKGYGTYVVRRGDVAGSLAELSGVSVQRMRELNPGVGLDRLSAGARLRLPATAAQMLSARPVERVASADERKGNGGAGGRHKIKPGETLSGIALEYGVTVEALQAANDLSGSTIVSGRTLRIPGSGGGSAAPERKGGRSAEHKVKEGETLWGIAREHGVTVEALQAANDLSGSVIVPGRTLRVPGGEKKGEEKSPEPRFEEYVVKNGDTLWGIARAHDTTIEAIQAANGMKSEVVRAGQKLRVPKK